MPRNMRSTDEGVSSEDSSCTTARQVGRAIGEAAWDVITTEFGGPAGPLLNTAGRNAAGELSGAALENACHDAYRDGAEHVANEAAAGRDASTRHHLHGRWGDGG